MENEEILLSLQGTKEKTSEDEDYALIRKFNEGDDHSFTLLVSKHREKVRNLVYLTLNESEPVDDIAQDVFISVFYNIREFRYESKFTTWLYRITINKCRDFLRKKKVRSIFVSVEEEDYPHSRSFQPDNEVTKLVNEAIQRLPEKLKTPLILRDIDGLSYKEISDQLGCEIGTIKSRIFRARETLKIILEPYQNDLY